MANNYEELVKELRKHNGWALNKTLDAAADAIEELQRHYCRHAIHNEHDRGDDSLCDVLMTEPPRVDPCADCVHYPPSSMDGKVFLDAPTIIPASKEGEG